MPLLFVLSNFSEKEMCFGEKTRRNRRNGFSETSLPQKQIVSKISIFKSKRELVTFENTFETCCMRINDSKLIAFEP